jgi:hypothetical protein
MYFLENKYSFNYLVNIFTINIFTIFELCGKRSYY